MTTEERTNFKVGATVLLGIAILLGGIGWAKSWHFGSKLQTVRAVFATAGGLEVGDPVTINGVKRGRVESVDLRSADVLVGISFSEPVDLRRDAKAGITMLELMGGKKVELTAGSAPQHLPDNAIIPGVYTGDIGSMVAMVGSLSGNLQSITLKADTLFTSLNAFFSGDGMQTDVKATLANAQKALGDIDRTAGQLSQMLTANGPTLQRTLQQADIATKDLGGMLNENRAGLHGFLDSTGHAVAETRATLAKANMLVMRMDSLMAGSNKENTLFYRLMKDQSFAAKLDSTLAIVNTLFEQIRTQGVDANIRFFNSSKPNR